MSNFAAAKTFNEKIIMQNSANILITGATGFIGGFIVDKALEKGMNVWVAVRPTSSRKYLADKRINFIHLDFDDKLQMTGRISALNNDKYNIMKQRNWRCDISPAEDELGFHPEYDLDSGVRQTIKWYKDNGWL